MTALETVALETVALETVALETVRGITTVLSDLQTILNEASL